MTAHIEPQLPGAGFDELTRDLEDLSAQYQGLELAETPRLSTDAAIKAAAARALRPQPEPSLSAAELVLARRRRMHRWRVPIALAALLVLCASAGLVLWREQHSTLLAARDVPAPAAHDAHTTQGVLTAELGPTRLALCV